MLLVSRAAATPTLRAYRERFPLMGLGRFPLGATGGPLVGRLTDGTPRGVAFSTLCGHWAP
jgi:hypothetical protein